MNITQLFGSAANQDNTTATNPVLSTDFDSVKSAGSWDTPPTDGLTSGAKWLLAIIQTAKAAIALITDNSNSVTVGNPTVSVQTINGTQYDVYSYAVGFRFPRTAPSTPDPDNI